MSKYTSIVQDPFADLNDHQAIMERLKALMLDVYDLTEKSRLAIAALSEHNYNSEAHPDLRDVVSANQRAAQLYTDSAIHDHNISPVAHQAIFSELEAVRDLIHNASNVDKYVQTTPASTTKAYITGTTASSTSIGDLVIDRYVYLDTEVGTVVASTFRGNLDGTATHAGTAISAANASYASTAELATSAASASYATSAHVAASATGNAATATSATIAGSAISAGYAVSASKLSTPCAFTITDHGGNHSGTPSTFGGDNSMYISLPTAITATTFSGNLSGTATSATVATSSVSAGVATKIGTTNVGSSNQPVYILSGVPKVVDNFINVSCVYAISAGTAGNQAAIGSATVGSPTTPIYINSGIPTTCSSSLSVSCSYANSAASTELASRALTADACTGNAITASKLGSLTVGSTNKPVYFSAGVPAVCGTSLAVSCSYATTAGTANSLSTSVANSLESTYTKYTSDIWVSPTGNDSNNGLTQSTPIKTFNKLATLLSIYSPYTSSNKKGLVLQPNTSDDSYTYTEFYVPCIVVHLAAGTYTDDLCFYDVNNVAVRIHGQVIINGHLYVSGGSNITILGGSVTRYSNKNTMISELALTSDGTITVNTPKLTLNGLLSVDDRSQLNFFVSLLMRSGNTDNVSVTDLYTVKCSYLSHLQFEYPAYYESDGTATIAPMTYTLEYVQVLRKALVTCIADAYIAYLDVREGSSFILSGSSTLNLRYLQLRTGSIFETTNTKSVVNFTEDGNTFYLADAKTNTVNAICRVGASARYQCSGITKYLYVSNAINRDNLSTSEEPSIFNTQYTGYAHINRLELRTTSTAISASDASIPHIFRLEHRSAVQLTGYVYYDATITEAILGSRVILSPNCYFPTDRLSGVPVPESTSNKQIPGYVYLDQDDRTPITLRYPSEDTSSWSVPIINIQARDKASSAEWTLPVVTYHHASTDTISARYMVNLEFGSTGTTYLRAGEDGAKEFVEYHAMDANEQVCLVADGEIKFYPKWANKGYFNDDDSYIRMTPHFIPNVTEKLNIGAAANRWNAVYAKSVNFSGNITANAGTAALKSITIADGGSIKPVVTNTVTIGTNALRFTDLYITASAINGSDERIKDYIEDIPEELLDVWEDIRFYVFKFKDSIENKGDDARYHAGCIAQRIQEVCNNRGVDPTKYGFFCYDKWDATEAVLDDDGNVLEPAIEAGELYSLRYEELLLIEAAYQRRRSTHIEERVKELSTQVEELTAKLEEQRNEYIHKLEAVKQELTTKFEEQRDALVEEMDAKIANLEAKYQSMYSYITRSTDKV